MKGQDSPHSKKGKADNTNVRSSNSKKMLLLVILGVVAAVGGSIFAFMNNPGPEVTSTEVTDTLEKEDGTSEPTLGIGAQIALANQNVHNNCPSCSTAIVKPVFTHSAYQKGAFYTFYDRHKNDATTQNDLNMLTTQVLQGWGQSRGALVHFYPLIKNNTINVITDIDVHNNDITQYKKLVLLHSEYVTQQYYDNLRNFVEKGGTLILFDANSLYAEVAYDNVANTITLLLGHSWSYDGIQAEKSVEERWEQENQEFIGSNYGGQGKYNEENVLKNPDAMCLHEWDSLPSGEVCTYRLSYGDGVVYHTGVFGSWNARKEIQLQQLVQGFLLE